MISTKNTNYEFGHIAYVQNNQVLERNTQDISYDREDMIKLNRKAGSQGTFSGHSKVNYSEKSMKEAYRKINRRLGGFNAF